MNKVHAINSLGNMWYLLIAKHNFPLSSSKNNKQNYAHHKKVFCAYVSSVPVIAKTINSWDHKKYSISHAWEAHRSDPEAFPYSDRVGPAIDFPSHNSSNCISNFVPSHCRYIASSTVIRYHCNHQAHG